MGAGWRDFVNLIHRWHTGRKAGAPTEPGGICVEVIVRPAVTVMHEGRPAVEIGSTVSPATAVSATVQCGG